MNDIHRRFFEMYLMDQDGRTLSPALRAELHAHLPICPDCRADQKLYQELRAQAGQRWPVNPAPVSLEKVLRSTPRQSGLRWAAVPLRVILWAGFALLALALVQWIFTYLRPAPAGLPLSSPTPEQSTPPVTPIAPVEEFNKIPVQPILQGDLSGEGLWSPEADYFFVPILEPAPPGGDRRKTSLHFIASSTGQDCQAPETFLAPQGLLEGYAWLDNERVLVIDKQGRALLITRCQAGFQDLSDRFSEPLLRVARPLTSPELAVPGPVLLQGISTYWLLDPTTLQARHLEDPVPSSHYDPSILQDLALKDPSPTLDLKDSFAWLPSGREISIMQPVAEKPLLSRLVVLNRDSGQVLRTLETEASSEGPIIVEWMGAERPFVWSLGAGGPLLVDLSVDPPRQVRVLPELLGLDLDYPEGMSSMGAFYSPANDSYHIVIQVNQQGDQSIYVYHSETGQVEKLAGERPVMMILPNDQRMPLVPLQDKPTYDTEFDLVRVDVPDQSPVRLQVAGHMPRNYPNLSTRLLPGSDRMLFGSTQGISLLDLTSGETLAFWGLVGAENTTLPTLSLAPHGRALIVKADPGKDGGFSQLYWLALEE